MKTNQPIKNDKKKELYETQIKAVLSACLNDHKQFEYVSGILVGYGYNTMVEFIEKMSRYFGLSYELIVIGALYYYVDFSKEHQQALLRVASEVKA